MDLDDGCRMYEYGWCDRWLASSLGVGLVVAGIVCILLTTVGSGKRQTMKGLPETLLCADVVSECPANVPIQRYFAKTSCHLYAADHTPLKPSVFNSSTQSHTMPLLWSRMRTAAMYVP
jgi:hypothetical protein